LTGVRLNPFIYQFGENWQSMNTVCPSVYLCISRYISLALWFFQHKWPVHGWQDEWTISFFWVILVSMCSLLIYYELISFRKFCSFFGFFINNYVFSKSEYFSFLSDGYAFDSLALWIWLKLPMLCWAGVETLDIQSLFLISGVSNKGFTSKHSVSYDFCRVVF
jgi:hypothetical protein